MGAWGQQRLLKSDRLWQCKEEDGRESRVREKGGGEPGFTSSLSRRSHTYILTGKDQPGKVSGSAIQCRPARK